MTINPKRIEEISLNAWPALQQVLYDGWILRLAKGYTKRANSVNPLYTSTLDLEEKVVYCEEFYTARSLRPVFRLTPFSSPPNLDHFLEQRNYQVLDRTLVMVLDLETLDFHTHREIDLLSTNIDEWIEIFYQVSAASFDDHEVHKEILEAISTECYLVAIEHDAAYAACGLGVLEGEYIGLFDLVTDPEARRRGYGTQIVLAILGWARKQGARYSYLQVVRQNFPARKLYEKIGFKELYRYWYRVPEIA
jgi:GNAT superfamily N-acetyltransferase